MGLQTRPYSGCDSVSTPDQPNIPIMFDWAGETAVLRQEEPRLSLGSESASHAARGSVAKTPYFPKTISCLVCIMGKTGDSGHSPSCDDNGKKTTIPNEFRESSRRVSRIKIRACFGQVSITLPLPGLMVETRPVFPGVDLLSSLLRRA